MAKEEQRQQVRVWIHYSQYPGLRAKPHMHALEIETKQMTIDLCYFPSDKVPNKCLLDVTKLTRTMTKITATEILELHG